MLSKSKRKILLLLTMILVVLIGCATTENQKNTIGKQETLRPVSSAEATPTESALGTVTTTKEPEVSTTPTKQPEESATQKPATQKPAEHKVESLFEVHYIDCGQGDSILLRSDNQTMLIDAANNNDGRAIVDYLKNQGIKKLDYVIGTHPDADHVGGLDTVINSLDVGKVYLPKKQNNTKTFEDVLLAISNKGLKISAPKLGTKITLGSAVLTILGPINYYDDDNNNNSIVIRAVHGQNSFLFTGDAELQEEQDLMEAGEDLSATVLKVGHHGSSSSTSRSFLEKVNPKYAIISCGAGNKYGHPHQETMTYLDMYQVKVYRTDLQQTIIMKSDGNKLKVTTGNPSAMGGDSYKGSTDSSKNDTQIKDNTTQNKGDSAGVSYIGNKNSKKFHLPSCSTLPAEKNRVYFNSRKEAVSSGYDPCGRCHP